MDRDEIMPGAEPENVRKLRLSLNRQFVAFDLHRAGGKVTREKGQILEVEWLGFTRVGRVPEAQATIRGKSGRSVIVRVSADHVQPL